MCFSPEMDLAAGTAVTLVGLDALRHVTRPRQWPLAALPVVFGVHQLVETLVWWELQGRLTGSVLGQECRVAGSVAAWAYVLIAICVVPVLVPVAFAALRTSRAPAADVVFVTAGVVVALVGLHALLDGPLGRRIEGHHVAYSVDPPVATLFVAVYVLATCGPGLAARSRPLLAFGALNLVVVALLAWLMQDGLISLWCVWAAVTSVLVAVHLRREAQRAPAAAPALADRRIDAGT
ncbi:hypothetical protein K8Z61_11135 [Nocardioides sp. TRM66260-LWL]|uniref:DUF6629 family protein n=1 Tax=Nocardioides sp. TRM66260-LWL TaxID=2874478 RepID=UPI001CC79629|nr:DUF6629 family protein [Nocardioides sp. TRM66260-LWL]MBZ5735052.1 hypothetical protein [Nocardioides sp. TRM66260-LWL]